MKYLESINDGEWKQILVCFFFISTTVGFAQTGSISGTVSDNEGKLQFAPVQIVNTGLGTYTDEKGYFEITGIPAGKKVLKVRALGHQTYTREIDLSNDEKLNLDIILTEDHLNLNEVVVSGTRYEMDRSEAPVFVNVLDDQIFKATQSMAISESLNYQPGVRVETNCQNCGFTQVRLNGLEGSYSQILINSRAVFSALNSVYGLDQIPTNIVEQVEVVRSGGSALYGSNAIAGTINIITKEPVENTWQIGSNFSLIDGVTPDNTLNFNGSIVNKDLSSGVTFYGMFRDRESFDANDDGFSELVRMENNTLGAKAFFKPGDRSKISVDFSAIDEYRRGGDRLDLVPHFTDITEELDHSTVIAGITYDQWSRSQRTKFSTYLSAQNTNRKSYYGGLGGGRTKEDSLSALNAYGNTEDLSLVSGIQMTHYFSSGNTLTMGMENQLSDVLDDIPGYDRKVDQRVNSLGFYSQFEWNPTERFTALLGARYDLTSVDGTYQLGELKRNSDVNLGVVSPRITLMYDITPTLQLRGGYARGFRAPQAFNEDLHISSVGGEPQFVILSDDLDKELSDAFTASLNFTRNMGSWQSDFLIEGFYTKLRDPFTFVSTGNSLPNGSILEEVRNGSGASVSGANFEMKLSPFPVLSLQLGGTWQRSQYDEIQLLFEPDTPNENESEVTVEEFTRNPNFYGYFTTYWKATENLSFDLTGAYTGAMIVPRVVNTSGFLDLVETDPFLDVNCKVSYHIDLIDGFHLELSGGVQNLFDSYQDDFDSGPERDSDYVYGPARPRTFFVGIKIGNLH